MLLYLHISSIIYLESATKLFFSTRTSYSTTDLSVKPLLKGIPLSENVYWGPCILIYSLLVFLYTNVLIVLIPL